MGQRGLKLIIGYKWVKALVQFALAGLVLAFAFSGHAATLLALLPSWASSVATPGYLLFTGTLLAADALLSLVEGWSLHRKYAWGAWLVVIATASLIPLEVVHLIRRFTAPRVLLLAVNLAIVAYLTRMRLQPQ